MDWHLTMTKYLTTSLMNSSFCSTLTNTGNPSISCFHSHCAEHESSSFWVVHNFSYRKSNMTHKCTIISFLLIKFYITMKSQCLHVLTNFLYSIKGAVCTMKSPKVTDRIYSNSYEYREGLLTR